LEFSSNEKNGIEYLTIPAFERSGLTVHGFSQRDIKKPEDLSGILNIDPTDLTQAEQVHGDKIYVIDEKIKGTISSGCDALLTRIPNIPLVIRTADCVPIFLLDPKTMSVGLVHAGWRGSLLNIAGKSIRKMRDSFKSKPEDILAAIAPSIGPCCYEIKENVIKDLKEKLKNWKEFTTTSADEKSYLNLRKLNSSQLIEAGVPKTNITMSKECTACASNRFYSYRKEGEKAGRMFALIMLKGF